MEPFDFGAYVNQPNFGQAPTAREPAPMTAPAPSTPEPEKGASVKLLPAPSMYAPTHGSSSAPQRPGGGGFAPMAAHHRGHRRARRGMGDDTAESSSNLLGLSLVLVPVAAVFGARYAGILGALGGALLGGAAVNTVRAAMNVTSGTASADKEATVSGTFAAIGTAGGLFLLYKGHGSSRGGFKANEPEPEPESGDYDIGKFRI